MFAGLDRVGWCRSVTARAGWFADFLRTFCGPNQDHHSAFDYSRRCRPWPARLSCRPNTVKRRSTAPLATIPTTHREAHCNAARTTLYCRGE